MADQPSNKSRIKPRGPLPEGGSVSEPKKSALKLGAEAEHETGQRKEKLIKEAEKKAA
jgi:hypothetical protein